MSLGQKVPRHAQLWESIRPVPIPAQTGAEVYELVVICDNLAHQVHERNERIDALERRVADLLAASHHRAVDAADLE